MSRIGKKIIEIPKGVTVTVNNRVVTAKGPKGELQHAIPEAIAYNFEDNVLTFSRSSEEKHIRALHGLTRALTWNIIEGVEKGFSKTLLIQGVGYKAEMKGEKLLLSVGYSHPVLVIPPSPISFEVPNPTTVVIKGNDKQLVGQISAKIRKVRPPEPYKGKGIRYQDEYVRRKAGKSGAK